MMTGKNRGKLTLGPVLFNWAPEVWRDFYFRIADEADVDIVYLGETVCLKRMPFIEPHLADVAGRLEAAGKEIVFSTLALVMNVQERKALAAIAGGNDSGGGDYCVEANDIAALGALAGRAHVIGPYVNVYNEDTLAHLARGGARRICLPPELPESAMEPLGKAAKSSDVELEVFAFGRMPLAVSARCYHARSHNLSKDNCQFVCDQDKDGLALKTLDDEDFLAINGIQTMSHSVQNLLPDLRRLDILGISHFRLSPHSCDMVQVAHLFRKVLDGAMDADEASGGLAQSGFGAPFCNGYLHGQAGKDWQKRL